MSENKDAPIESYQSDPKKMMEPATKGELATVAEYLRGTIVALFAASVSSAQGDRMETLDRLEKVLDADADFANLMKRIVGKDDE